MARAERDKEGGPEAAAELIDGVTQVRSVYARSLRQSHEAAEMKALQLRPESGGVARGEDLIDFAHECFEAVQFVTQEVDLALEQVVSVSPERYPRVFLT